MHQAEAKMLLYTWAAEEKAVCSLILGVPFSNALIVFVFECFLKNVGREGSVSKKKGIVVGCLTVKSLTPFICCCCFSFFRPFNHHSSDPHSSG